MPSANETSSRRKESLRAEVRRLRVGQPDKELLSQVIWKRLIALPEYENARRVIVYIDHRSEVRTRTFLADIWAAKKQVVVPYCEGDDLGLFRMEHLGELEPGTMGILEPQPKLRQDAARAVRLEPSDLIILPGVAFDRQGGRLGQGGGYYDRLLKDAPDGVVCIGIAFECQLVEAVPCMPHDMRVDKVVTEVAVYARSR